MPGLFCKRVLDIMLSAVAFWWLRLSWLLSPC